VPRAKRRRTAPTRRQRARRYALVWAAMAAGSPLAMFAAALVCLYLWVA
jgi:hypothetical protein